MLCDIAYTRPFGRAAPAQVCRLLDAATEAGPICLPGWQKLPCISRWMRITGASFHTLSAILLPWRRTTAGHACVMRSADW